MIGISTAYLIDISKSWTNLLEHAARLGYDNFELNIDIPSIWLSDIKNSVLKGECKILSIHNFCPKVGKIPDGRTPYSPYFITSEDKSEREIALELTKKTIDTAFSVGAPVVVIHAGEVMIKPSGRDFGRFVQEFGVKSQLYRRYLEELKANREKSAERYLLNAIKSLKEIVEYAESKGIKIALENRFFYHEIPLLREFETIFNEIKSKKLGLWYDTGHAEIFIRMGFMESHKELLEPYKEKIFGFHLHDVRGLKDHYAPGEGELDFKQFLPYTNFETTKIIEAHPYASSSAVKKASCLFETSEMK